AAAQAGLTNFTRASANCSTCWRSRATNSCAWTSYSGRRGLGQEIRIPMATKGVNVFVQRVVWIAVLLLPGFSARADEIFLRASQVGYHMNAAGVAVVFSKSPLPENFSLVAADNERHIFFQSKTKPITNATWGQFAHYAELDFS